MGTTVGSVRDRSGLTESTRKKGAVQPLQDSSPTARRYPMTVAGSLFSGSCDARARSTSPSLSCIVCVNDPESAAPITHAMHSHQAREIVARPIVEHAGVARLLPRGLQRRRWWWW